MLQVAIPAATHRFHGPDTRFLRPNPLPSGSSSRFRSSRLGSSPLTVTIASNSCFSGSWVGHPHHGPDARFPVEHRSSVDRLIRFRVDLRYRVELRSAAVGTDRAALPLPISIRIKWILLCQDNSTLLLTNSMRRYCVRNFRCKIIC